MRISVKTVNDNLPDFAYLFQIWQEVHETQSRVTFDFSNCAFLRPNAIAFLGGLARLIEHNAGSAIFEWNTLKESTYKLLAQNGFMEAFGGPRELRESHSIPFREDKREDGKSITAYLKDQWLGRGWVQVSPLLGDEIVSRVVEIYDNAFAHSSSPIGVMSCGQHFPKLQKLKLAVVDYGIGIPTSVRAFLNEPGMSAAKAIEWALQSGTTTKPTDISRGLGLDLLKTFVSTNRGRLEIFSGGGYAVITEFVERCIDRSPVFNGTLINITLQCDEAYYCLDSELFDEPLF